MLRTSILDAARARATSADWSSVHLTDIAEDVGVSRQTIYNEFGGKEALGAAVFRRELAQFEAGLVEIIRCAPDFRTAIRDALTWVLTEAGGHDVLQQILRSARHGDGGLLPLLTVRGDVILVPLRDALTEACLERWPADRPRVEMATEMVIRMGLSQVIAPSDRGQDDFVAMVVEMVVATLRAPATT